MVLWFSVTRLSILYMGKGYVLNTEAASLELKIM